MNIVKPRFEIDYNKWQTELKLILEERQEERAKTEKKYWAALDYHYDEKLTKLYSIRAHARGRIHRQFAILNEYKWRKLKNMKNYADGAWKNFYENDGVIKFALTIEDQAVYIGEDWKEFEKQK